MSRTYYSLITRHGEQVIAKAIANNTPVPLKTMAVGDGNGTPTTPQANQTALVREVYRAEITDLLHDQQDNQQVIAELLIPETVGNFTVREIGIFDEQNKLVAVANCPENYKPVLEQGSGKVQYYRIILRVSNNDAVTLSINNNIVYATRVELNRLTDNLAAPDGFKYIGQAESIAQLRTIEPTTDQQRILLKSWHAGKNLGGGEFYADFADTISADNGGTVIVTAGGKRWKRIVTDTLRFTDFGVQTGKTVAAETTEKINACFKFAYEHHIHNVVNDIPGDYYINSFINIGDNLTFENVEGVRYLRNKYTAMLYNGLCIKADSSAENSAKNIRIIGGEFDSNAEEQWSAVNFMSLGYIKGLHIEGVTFTNCIRNHAIDLSACSDVIIENCHFLGFSPDKTTKFGTAPDQGIESRNFSEAIQIDDNTQGTFSGGALKGDPDYNVLIRNNVFSGNPNDTTGLFRKGYGCAVGAHYAARNVKHHNNIIIENNLIADCIYAGIRPFLWDDVKIIGNTFRGNHRNIYIWWLAETGVNPSEAGKNYHIAHNNFEDSVAQNILTQIFGNNYSGNFAYLENVIISNNKFGNTEWDGAVIHLQGVKNATVSNNLFDEAKRFIDVDYSRRVNIINNSGNNLNNEFFASKNNLYSGANIIGTTEDVYISGNFAQNCTAGVLYLQKMRNVVVTNNSFINIARTRNTHSFRAFEVDGLWCDNNVVQLAQRAVTENVRVFEAANSCTNVGIGSFITNSAEVYRSSAANLTGVDFGIAKIKKGYADALIVGKEGSTSADLLVHGTARVKTPPADSNNTTAINSEWFNSKFNGQLTRNGWARSPSGLIFQWGNYNADNGRTFDFPVAFNEVFNVYCTDENAGGTAVVALTVTAKTNTNFTISANGSVGLFAMLAVGR